MAISIGACDKEPATPNQEPTEPEAKTVEAPAAIASLPASGRKFDPPIEPDTLPQGSYYCDMGTTHWATSTMPSNAKCPVCGMNLKQFGAKPILMPVEPKKKEPAPTDGPKGANGQENGDHDHAH